MIAMRQEVFFNWLAVVCYNTRPGKIYAIFVFCATEMAHKLIKPFQKRQKYYTIIQIKIMGNTNMWKKTLISTKYETR